MEKQGLVFVASSRIALLAMTIISPALTQFLRFFLLLAETTHTGAQSDVFSSLSSRRAWRKIMFGAFHYFNAQFGFVVLKGSAQIHPTLSLLAGN